MTTKELIREKIDALYTEYKAKFHQNGDSYHLGIIDGLDIAERILDTLPDEPITTCNELAEAAEKYGSDYPAYNDDQFIAENAFKAGAEWMKQKMMEGAVEGTVIELGETYKDLSLSVNAKELNQVLQPLGVGDGNKVKIIIVKEEEK